jgi:hypothetical protein
MIPFLGRPRAVTVGEGHAPVVAVLQADELIPAPKDTDPGTARNFPCITALSERHGEGP